jgi:hypothetical protein
MRAMASLTGQAEGEDLASYEWGANGLLTCDVHAQFAQNNYNSFEHLA